MTYKKQTFVDDEALSAAQLNHMEDGIYEANQNAEKKAEINNAAVGTDAWSSKNIVERLCPAINESGSYVACTPVEGYPLGVVSKITAVQLGSGDPSPDNVRPITVCSKLTLARCGKNLFNKDAFPFIQGYIHASSGESTSSASSNYCRTDAYIDISHLQGQTITLNHPPIETGGGNPGMAFYDAEKAYISGINDYTMTVPANAVYMRFSVPLAYKDGSQIQIELGSVVTEYEAYRGQLFAIALPEGAACGTYDWNTGLLTVTHKAVDMSALDWSDDDNGDSGYWWAALNDAAIPDSSVANDAICSVLVWTDGFEYIVEGGGGEYDFWDIGDDSKKGRIIVFSSNRVYEMGTPQEVFASVNATLVYPLAEPYTVQYDPQQVLALEGTNYLVSGNGDTAVTGRADPRALNTSIMARLAALEAAAVNNT